jgi:putative ATP-binding cassette transporter
MSLFSFSVMLYQISPNLVVVLLGYSLVSSTFLSLFFGKSLAQLNVIRSDLVSRLRQGLIALRLQSESIAFFKAETDEKISIDKKNRELAEHDVKIAAAQRNFSFLDFAYQWSAGLVPPLVLAPRFFRG